MDNEYFSARNLREEYGDLKIDLSFSCGKSTMTSIVGPSGSGKSTILRLIAGLETGGSIKKSDLAEKKIILDGKEITSLAPAKREIGMVFQNHALFDHLTVQDNIGYGLVSSGMKKSQAREEAREFMKYFGLEGLEKRYPATLSGGEAQRVSLARTLIIKPKLVLFDEPLSALDAPLRKKLAGLIKDLEKSFGFTGIMVTHDIEEAKTVSDRILLIKKGKIHWNGNAADFREEFLED